MFLTVARFIGDYSKVSPGARLSCSRAITETRARSREPGVDTSFFADIADSRATTADAAWSPTHCVASAPPVPIVIRHSEHYAQPDRRAGRVAAVIEPR